MSLEKPPAESPSVARRVLDDPRVLRALAHPLRLSLHRLLIREGSCTAAYAARELGISQGLATHHLRQLAKYGFAEQTAGRDRRERLWRPLSTSSTWLGADRTEEGTVAAGLFEQTLLEQSLAALVTWQERRRDPENADWRDVTGLDTSLLYLTSSEALELSAGFDELCRRFVSRRTEPMTRQSDERPVEVTLLLVPLTPTASGA